ncbi:hypothetical protein [Intestinimonas butyriciproducens]|nr:hypothetical protein [Intestinimonas butyriciproducens]
MDQLYACFKESIERQQQLLDVEIRYPYTTMLGFSSVSASPRK